MSEEVQEIPRSQIVSGPTREAATASLEKSLKNREEAEALKNRSLCSP